MKKLLFFFVSCLVSFCVFADKKSPNFIIFYMDDLGWAQTSVKMMDEEPLSRSTFYETPNVERLAKRGMKFSNAYSPTPTCTGSRVSIQFGQTSARTQYRFVHDVLSKKQRPNGYRDEITIASMLKQAKQNYITAHYGKGIGVDKLENLGYDVTDEYEEIAPNGNLHGDYIGLKNKKKLPKDDPKRIYSLTNESLKFLDKHAGKRPFFMMISHYAVHGPHAASEDILKKWQDRYDKLDKPTDKRDLDRFYRERTPLFASMIEESDTHLGKLMDFLAERGELENTYIIYTSDNGAEWAPRNKKRQRYNGPLTQGKYFPFEGGVRVPFVVAGPGIPGETQCDIPVIQWDILPTFHDLANSTAPMPPNVDGGSLKEVFFKGNKAADVKRVAPGLVFHFPSYYQPPLSCIRVGDFKFMRNMNSGEIRLYNVKEDYREENDLSKEMPEKIAQLDKLLRDYVQSVDGGEVEDVYQAALDTFDGFEKSHRKAYETKRSKLIKSNPTDLDAQLVKLREDLDKKLLAIKVKREMIKDQRNYGDWHSGAAVSTMKRIGIKKSGDITDPEKAKVFLNQ